MLRPYQIQLIDRLRGELIDGKNRLIAQLPTGAGKTFTFCAIIKSALDKGSKVLVLTDRIELLSQAGGSLESFGLYPENIESGKHPELYKNLYVAMVETLNRRVNNLDYIKFLDELDLIIIDECHIRNFTKIFDHIRPQTTVLGFTATPSREGREKHLSKEYQRIIEGVSISYLIENKFLSKPHYFGVKADLSKVKTKMGDYDQNQVAEMFTEQKLYVGVVENYKRLTPGKKGIVFSSNISNSIEVCNEFVQNGYDAKHLDSTFSAKERESILEWFDNSKDGILCNVGILTRGFDQPDIEVVILYRATKSLPLYLQMVGRGSRTTKTKKDFYILDFGNNIPEHNFWHIDRTWSLEMPKKKTKKELPPPIKECPECLAILPISVQFCTECGYEFVKSDQEREIAELEEMTYEDIKNEIKQGISFELLEAIQRAKGYKKGWILRQLNTETELIQYAKYKGYKRAWVNYQLKFRENEVRG